MRTSRLLFSASLAAFLLGCQTPSRTGTIGELPSNNPTATTAELANGS
ncbi:hypothetical protein ACHAC9_01430 [Massilia sp. CMS3.1]